MSYEVIIDVSDVERRSLDFKRMFDESIPCKERIVRCRDCKCRRDWAPEELSGFDEAQVADGWCRSFAWGWTIAATAPGASERSMQNECLHLQEVRQVDSTR